MPRPATSWRFVRPTWAMPTYAMDPLVTPGPGRQSGLPAFLFGDLLRDAELLSLARREAFAMIESDPSLAQPENQALKRAIWARWGQRLQLAEIG